MNAPARLTTTTPAVPTHPGNTSSSGGGDMTNKVKVALISASRKCCNKAKASAAAKGTTAKKGVHNRQQQCN